MRLNLKPLLSFLQHPPRLIAPVLKSFFALVVFDLLLQQGVAWVACRV